MIGENLFERIRALRKEAAELAPESMNPDRVLRDIKDRFLTFLVFVTIGAIVFTAESGRSGDGYAVLVLNEQMGPHTLYLVAWMALVGLFVMMALPSHGIRKRVAALSDNALSLAVLTGGLATGQLAGTACSLARPLPTEMTAAMLWLPILTMVIVAGLSYIFVATRGDDNDDPYGWLLKVRFFTRCGFVITCAIPWIAMVVYYE